MTTQPDSTTREGRGSRDRRGLMVFKIVLVCSCGHDEYSHDRKHGPYVLCSMPGCKCADRNYVRAEKRRRPR